VVFGDGSFGEQDKQVAQVVYVHVVPDGFAGA
jgi:hypothetical protein